MDVSAFHRTSDWSRVRATVAGFGVSGFAAADNLTHLGARVVALDENADGREEEATLLQVRANRDQAERACGVLGRAYVERRTKEGLSKPEIMRCIKRYLAREIYHALVADFAALHAT